MKKSITAAIFTVIILTNPIAVVQTVSLIFSFDWMNVIALVVIIVGGGVIEIILIHIHDSQAWKQIIGRYFCDFDDCVFESTKIKLEQGKKIRDMLRDPRALFLSRFLLPKIIKESQEQTQEEMPGIQAFYVYRCSDPQSKHRCRNPPSTLTTYQMAGGTSYVFLPWKPEKIDSFKRFYLLHEIGHAFITNRVIYAQGWFAAVYFCLLFVFVAFHREAGIPALLVALALAVMWAYYMLQRSDTDERLELAADTFALVHLYGRHDFLTTIDRVARTFPEGSERARLLIQRAQILSRTGTESSLEWEQGLNLFNQMMLPIPLWLGLLILAGMLWLGATLTIKDVEELLALGLVWIVVPALGYYYYMFLRVKLPYTARARREALAFLQDHAPPDLPAERHVTLSDLT